MERTRGEEGERTRREEGERTRGEEGERTRGDECKGRVRDWGCGQLDGQDIEKMETDAERQTEIEHGHRDRCHKQTHREAGRERERKRERERERERESARLSLPCIFIYLVSNLRCLSI